MERNEGAQEPKAEGRDQQTMKHIPASTQHLLSSAKCPSNMPENGSQKSCQSQGQDHLLRCILFNASPPSRNPPHTPHMLYQGQVSAV